MIWRIENAPAEEGKSGTHSALRWGQGRSISPRKSRAAPPLTSVRPFRFLADKAAVAADFQLRKWRLLTWETENSKHSKCSYTCEIRRGTTGISLQNSKQAPVSTHTGACHSGKQCTAVPTSHYLPTAKRIWQAMLVFIHPCNLVGEMPQTPERFQRNRLRFCGAEHQSIFGK